MEYCNAIESIMIQNMLPYAKGSLIDRAIVSIDGLKPVQRRSLYVMFLEGLLRKEKDRVKSQAIVGKTMGSYHPHGDSSIYSAIVNMSAGHEGLNVPYVNSKGNFGKVYNKKPCAASRYTEIKLTDICQEMFEGINEDAVDFKPTFDDAHMEPTLLPVKFPNILVNTSAGIAVGMSSYIPPFSLTKVCDATIGIINGTITEPTQLVDILEGPEFPTGGTVHVDRRNMERLCTEGFGKFKVSGSAATYPDKIVISEIPYSTTADDIVAEIADAVKSGELREISEAHDNTDKDGFRIIVKLKRGCNPEKVLEKLYRITHLRDTISFRILVVHNNRCRNFGIYELLKEWIEFRKNTIKRIYKYRLDKNMRDEHLNATWEKINGHIEEVAMIAARNSEDVAKNLLKNKFELDDEQAEYLLDFKIRQLTTTRVEKGLEKLYEIRNCSVELQTIVFDEKLREEMIVSELTEIRNKYGEPNKTTLGEYISDDYRKPVPEEISNNDVTVVLTRNGNIKRLISARDLMNFETDSNDPEIRRWNLKNNENLLVFTYSGDVYKILADTIDASRGVPKESLQGKLGLSSKNEILWMDAAGDYTKHFNVIYGNGRGTTVNYDKASGGRKKYKGLFEPCKPGGCIITFSDRFFIITKREKASYIDLVDYRTKTTRTAFKVARISTGDAIVGIKPFDDIKYKEHINLDRYMKEYTVSIGNDRYFGLSLLTTEELDRQYEERKAEERRLQEEEEAKSKQEASE